MQYFRQVACASLRRVGLVTSGCFCLPSEDGCAFQRAPFDHTVDLPFDLEFSLTRNRTGFYRFSLTQPPVCLLLSFCIPHISASRTSFQQVILSIFIDLVTRGRSVSLNPKCSNCHVETNSLSIFSTFNPQLLVIFSFFCIGSHGNKSVGRGSVTLLLAFCTLQNPSSDPQTSVIIKRQEETSSLG